MGFELEYVFERTGIDPAAFSRMDGGERYTALSAAGLDVYEYLLIDMKPELALWMKLRDAGLSLEQLSQMDKETWKKALKIPGSGHQKRVLRRES